MPLSVRIAFFTAKCAHDHAILACYHQQSADLEGKRLAELCTETDFLDILSINDTYDSQHHKLLDDLEKHLGQQHSALSNITNSQLVSGCCSSNPQMHGSMPQTSSAAPSASYASPVSSQLGQDACGDLSTDPISQAMPSDYASPSATVPQNKNLGPMHDDDPDIYLGPLSKVNIDAREIGELDTRIFVNWYEKNYDYPYPLGRTYDILVEATGLQKWQVEKWFNNRRTRDKNTRKFPAIVRGRKARMKQPAAVLKHQDDQLKKDIMAIKANYNGYW